METGKLKELNYELNILDGKTCDMKDEYYKHLLMIHAKKWDIFRSKFDTYVKSFSYEELEIIKKVMEMFNNFENWNPSNELIIFDDNKQKNDERNYLNHYILTNLKIKFDRYVDEQFDLNSKSIHLQ